MQQQAPVAPMYGGYGNYIPNAPAPPNYTMEMDQMGAQFNSYDFQGATAFPPAPSFGIDCPAPPGMPDGWIAPPSIQQGESEEDRMKREGEKFSTINASLNNSFAHFSCCRRGKETPTRRIEDPARPVHQPL